MKQEKEKLQRDKVQGQGANVLQRILRGTKVRIDYRKQLEAELDKNLSDLDKLSQVYFQKKNEVLKLPLHKVLFLVDNLKVIMNLRRGHPKIPAGKKQREYKYATNIISLAKWLERGLDSKEHSFIHKLDFKDRD